MAQFEALQVALQLAIQLGKILERIQHHDRDLAIQLRRAAASILSCLPEESQRTDRDRLLLYRTSAGSAAELKVQLQVAVAWDYLDAAAAEQATLPTVPVPLAFAHAAQRPPLSRR